MLLLDFVVASSADESGHGTHISGILAGKPYVTNEATEPLTSFSGIAYGAKIAFFDLQASASGPMYLPDNLGDDYFRWAADANAHIHSNRLEVMEE